MGLCGRMHLECHFSLDWNYYYAWIEAHIITITSTWLKLGTAALTIKENHCWYWNMDQILTPLKRNVLYFCASTQVLYLHNKMCRHLKKVSFFYDWTAKQLKVCCSHFQMSPPCSQHKYLLMEKDCMETRKPLVCVSPSLRTLVPFCGHTHTSQPAAQVWHQRFDKDKLAKPSQF